MFEVLTVANSILIIGLCWMHKDFIADLYPLPSKPKGKKK